MENQKLEEKAKSKNNKILIVSLVSVIIVVSFITLYFKFIKNPLPNLSLLKKEAKVSIKTEYKNPFDKKTQYVNPFETYKNPFVVAK